jgi:hypothetical protein
MLPTDKARLWRSPWLSKYCDADDPMEMLVPVPRLLLWCKIFRRGSAASHLKCTVVPVVAPLHSISI